MLYCKNRRGNARRAWVVGALTMVMATPVTNVGAQAASTAAQTVPATPASTPSGAEQQVMPTTTPVAPVSATRQGGGAIQEFRTVETEGGSKRRASTAAFVTPNLRLYAGETAIRRLPGTLQRVAVGDGGVVEVFAVGKQELVFIGTKPGATNVHLWLSNGSQRDISVDVSTGRSDGVADTVRDLLGDAPGTNVRSVGANVVITGKEVSAGVASRIAALQKVYPQILNLTGTDPVGMRPMVRMDVTIMEFNKNAVEDLGIRWGSTINGPGGGLIRDAKTNDYFRVLPKNEDTFQQIRNNLPTHLVGAQGYFGIASTISSQINLLMSRGKAWVLAEPKLSARSGSSASFLVGGEVPISVPSVLGQSQIEYKQYGILLDISPTVNEAKEVAASIKAEVSRLDPSVTVQGVPGFQTRRVETELNVKVGETIVISGLINREASKAVDKMPVLGDIPVLGKLFRSDGFRGNQTELVIFVTPRIVTPDSAENQEQLQQGQRMQDALQSDISPRQKNLITK